MLGDDEDTRLMCKLIPDVIAKGTLTPIWCSQGYVQTDRVRP
jgi:hypothetical protein